MDRMSLARMPPNVEQLRQPMDLASKTPSVEQLSQPSVQGMMYHQTIKEECDIVNRMSLAKVPPSMEQLSRPKITGMMNHQTMKDECVIADRLSLARMPPSVDKLSRQTDMQMGKLKSDLGPIIIAGRSTSMMNDPDDMLKEMNIKLILRVEQPSHIGI